MHTDVLTQHFNAVHNLS